MSNQLNDFIAHARQKGMDHATIRQILISAGWKEKDVAEALTAQTLDMPVPVPSDRGGAREAFFHLLAFASLYTTIVSLIILFFTYINRLLPDSSELLYAYSGDYDMSGIRWGMAAVIVTFPIFLWVSRLLIREMREHPERAWSGIRRWLTYLTLFVTAMAMIGDGITLLFYLLDGELSARFLLKVVVVLLLTGLTFVYYFVSLKSRTQKPGASMHKSFGMVASAITLLALVWGFFIAGSPMYGRDVRFDERRVADFQTISSEIRNIVYDNKAWDENAKPVKPIPATLDGVAADASFQKVQTTDPETGSPYEYTVTGKNTYELCATFSQQRDQPDIMWNHPAGRYCYRFDVTKDGVAKSVPAPVETQPVK